MAEVLDVLIVGAGPAGSVAATVLARAGVRVRVIDRGTFPRAKLCGDTLNPGTLAMLGRLSLVSAVVHRGLPIDGMRLTGEGGVEVLARYPRGLRGLAIPRTDLDCALLDQAMQAGASFEPGVGARRAIVSNARDGTRVEGVVVRGVGRESAMRARVTIAADGRRSPIAFGLGLARHPPAPRRWAMGAYFEGAAGMSAFGEMHIRRDCYIGVAPVPGGAANVCLVTPWVRGARPGSAADSAALRDSGARIAQALASDPVLRDRFAAARMIAPPTVLGPLAVDALSRGYDGLLLAGDAAGFIDPMTGDGMRFAVRGGELAALAALAALGSGWSGVRERLARQRAQEFGGKWRFNRALRTMVASPLAVAGAAATARVAPGLVRALVSRAGDCQLVGS